MVEVQIRKKIVALEYMPSEGKIPERVLAIARRYEITFNSEPKPMSKGWYRVLSTEVDETKARDLKSECIPRLYTEGLVQLVALSDPMEGSGA